MHSRHSTIIKEYVSSDCNLICTDEAVVYVSLEDEGFTHEIAHRTLLYQILLKMEYY